MQLGAPNCRSKCGTQQRHGAASANINGTAQNRCDYLHPAKARRIAANIAKLPELLKKP